MFLYTKGTKMNDVVIALKKLNLKGDKGVWFICYDMI